MAPLDAGACGPPHRRVSEAGTPAPGPRRAAREPYGRHPEPVLDPTPQKKPRPAKRRRAGVASRCWSGIVRISCSPLYCAAVIVSWLTVSSKLVGACDRSAAPFWARTPTATTA